MTILWIISGIITGLIAIWAFSEMEEIWEPIFSFILPCGSLWMILLGSCAIDGPEWFELDINEGGAISMVVIGVIILVLYIILFIVDSCYEDEYSYVSNAQVNIKDTDIKDADEEQKYWNTRYDATYPETKIVKVNSTQNKVSIYSKKYVPDLTAKKQSIFHVLLSKNQDISLEDLEFIIRDCIIGIDGPKYHKSDLIKSFKINGYFIIGSFDNDYYAREYRDNLKKHGIKSTVCDDEWVKSIKEEFDEYKNPIKLKFGDDTFEFQNNKNDEH